MAAPPYLKKFTYEEFNFIPLGRIVAAIPKPNQFEADLMIPGLDDITPYSRISNEVYFPYFTPDHSDSLIHIDLIHYEVLIDETPHPAVAPLYIPNYFGVGFIEIHNGKQFWAPPGSLTGKPIIGFYLFVKIGETEHLGFLRGSDT